jgi:hypothetical protein
VFFNTIISSHNYPSLGLVFLNKTTNMMQCCPSPTCQSTSSISIDTSLSGKLAWLESFKFPNVKQLGVHVVIVLMFSIWFHSKEHIMLHNQRYHACINVSSMTDNCVLNSDFNVEYSDSNDPYSSAIGPSQHVTNRVSFDLLIGDNDKHYFAAEHTNPGLGQATLASRSQFNLDRVASSVPTDEIRLQMDMAGFVSRLTRSQHLDFEQILDQVITICKQGQNSS